MKRPVNSYSVFRCFLPALEEGGESWSTPRLATGGFLATFSEREKLEFARGAVKSAVYVRAGSRRVSLVGLISR